MKMYEFFACSRSGHHAIINWIIKNLTGDFYPPNIKVKTMLNDKFIYINEGNFDINFTKNNLNNLNLNNIENFLTTYENATPDFTLFSRNNKFKGYHDFNFMNMKTPSERKRIIIIRDFYNNLASRIERSKYSNKYNIKPNKNFIDVWKSQAKYILDNKLYFIKYEDWLSNPDIRQNFLKDVFNIKEIYNENDVKIDNSSFKKTNKQLLLNRYEQVEIPNNVKDIIKSDNELHYLIGKLNYKYININKKLKNKIYIEYKDGFVTSKIEKFDVNNPKDIFFIDVESNSTIYNTQINSANQWHKTTRKSDKCKVILGDKEVTVSESEPKKIITY